MISISEDVVRQKIGQLDAEIAILRAKRDALNELLTASPDHLASQVTVDGRPRFERTPETRGATDQIKELLARIPGLTKLEVTDHLAGRDKNQRRLIYNTAHSLSRRGKICMDPMGRLYLTQEQMKLALVTTQGDRIKN